MMLRNDKGSTRTTRRLARDERGGVAVLFACSLVPLTLVGGAAIEYSRATEMRTRLTAAADAAALAGVLAAQTSLQSAQGGSTLVTPDLTAKAQKEGETAALNHFKGMTLNGAKISNLKTTPKITIAGQAVTSTVSFTGDVPMYFGAWFGKTSINIGNTVIANSGGGGSTGQYLDVHIVMDNSASMGVGATAADINAMLADPKMFPQDGTGCAFACHVGKENGIVYETDDYAKSAGYTLRIDVLKSAVQSVLSLANQKKASGDQFQFNLHTFANRLITLGPATTDYAALGAQVNAVRLTQTDGGTNFSYTIGKELAAKLQAKSGQGTGPGDRKTVVIIVTDGVENSLDKVHSDGSFTVSSPSTVIDWNSQYGWGHYLDANFVLFPSWNYTASNGSNVKATYYDGGDFKIQAMNPAICDSLKSKGASVGVLYVTPSAPGPTYSGVNAALFTFITNSIQTGANATLELCASSSSLYASANTPAEITAAMTTMFQKFTTGGSASARLTR